MIFQQIAWTSNDTVDPAEGGSNRRRFPRFAIQQKPRAAFISGRVRVSGEVRNIGLGGLFFHTKQPIAEGAEGELSVILPKGRFRTSVIVRHSDPNHGFSLEFNKMSSRDQDILWAYCSTLRGEPTRVT